MHAARKNNIRTQLARNVRVNRTLRGWSQERLAESCGLHRTYIGAVERAERNITLDNLEKIAIALEISASKLFANCELAYPDSTWDPITDKAQIKEAIPIYAPRNYASTPIQTFSAIHHHLNAETSFTSSAVPLH